MRAIPGGFKDKQRGGVASKEANRRGLGDDRKFSRVAITG